MNSELGMLLPFAFALFVVWSGTRILIARAQTRGIVPPDIHTRLADLAARLDQLEQVVEATAAEVQRVGEAERFTAELLVGNSIDRSREPAR